MKFSLAPIAILSLSLFSSVTQAATTFFHNDHLGTPQALTDENQQVVWKSEQEPFGESTQSTNVIEQNLRFPGQYFDVETGLHYNYFRDYDSTLGRYVQSDPIGLLAGLNTYGYVQSNPLSYFDPFGLTVTAFRVEVSNTFIVFHTEEPAESGWCVEDDPFDAPEILGLFTIDNPPCTFICMFTDQEWLNLAPKPPVPSEI